MALPFLGKPPVLDEESYLWLAAQLDPVRPYDWSRAWPPYDADGFVFAHPPLHLLWMWLCTGLTTSLPALRLLAGLPWLLLLGWAAGALFARTTRHPSLAAALWLASPVVALGLQDTWMIDLPATALATAALAAYREGLARAPRHADADGNRSSVTVPRPKGRPPEPVDEAAATRWFLLAGLLLGLGAATKYPVLLVGLVLAVHMARFGWRPWTLLLAAAVFLGVEAWVYGLYGRVHLWEVWERRHEIASGPLGARALGTLARLGLVSLPLVLARAEPATAGVGAAIAAGMLGIVRPEGLAAGELTLLFGCAALGGVAVARAGRAAVASGVRRRHGDRGDGLLLGGAALIVVIGVVTVHNYASARYLLPAAAPLAALLTRSAEEVSGGKALQRVVIALGAALALEVSVADLRYAQAADEAAVDAVAAVREAGLDAAPARRFAGEWTFRWRMEAEGWECLREGEALPAGAVVVLAENASPGAVDTVGWEPVRHVASTDAFGLRVNDVDAHVSLYAETLGPLPLGWASSPLEGAAVYVVRGGSR